MGRVSFNDAENYGGGNGGGFFSLKNDKDTARVRFLLDNAKDLDNITYAVHKVKIDDKDRYVSCLRNYSDPIDQCPLCASGNKVQLRFFIPLYNDDVQDVQVWDRGKNFANKLSSLMSRYGEKTPLVSHLFDIERVGKAGDMKTTYETYEVEEDGTMLEDLPEAPEILGGIVLDKTADELNYFLDEGEFPPEEDEAPVRRRNARSTAADDDPDDDEDVPPFDEAPAKERGSRAGSTRRSGRDTSEGNRRTPANSGGGRRRNF